MKRSELLVLGAATEAKLRGRARALRAALAEDGALAELCAAAAARPPEAHRLTVVAASNAELAARLDAYLAGVPADGVSAGRSHERDAVVFVFGGQGPEWWAMGRELYASEPVFADAVRACDNALATLSPTSITREFLVPESETRLGDVEVLQPVLFAVHVALVALFRSWGITPAMVVGHSFGEVSAAWAAGGLSLQDALRIHVTRSAVMKRLTGHGRMAVVECGIDSARAALGGLEDHVTIGVVNSPESLVLSGEHAALDQALARLAGFVQRPIPMPYAVHSKAMRDLMPEVVAALADIRPQQLSIPMFSTVSGGAVDQLDARHWARNIGEPARFDAALRAILEYGERGPRTFIEIGPHAVLGAVISQCAASHAWPCAVLPSLRRSRPERATLCATLGALVVRGHAVALYADVRGDERRLERALAAAHDDTPVTAAIVDELRRLPKVAQHERLTAYLGARVAHRLGIDRAAPATPLRDLGLDSALAVELASALGRELGTQLPATLFFAYPTVDAVAHFIATALGLTPRAVASATPAASATAVREPHEPIAIIGIGCRFPGGVAGPDALWRLLMAETDAVTEVPPSRWDVAGSFDADPGAPGKTYSKWAGLLTDVDRFDARFFGIAPREAQSMDPQQRLLLEVSWEALEHAGIAPGSLTASRTGVFVGLCTNDYGGGLLYGDPQGIDAYTFTGNAASVAAGRIAYVLGLEGPAVVVDTACSSSLVALHLACRSLRAGESDLALAGGVNLILAPTLMIYFSRLRALSPTGRSRAFDATADGYVRGEGCGVVALKRLADARAAGDRIIAVIRGSAVNQDGRSNGLTAPSGPAQQKVVRAALADAGVLPSQVGYVEAHGTGTPLGDPIELGALGAALGEGRAAEQPVIVGSIKTNCGHTEGAAGIAGVIKAALALRHRVIPRSLHFQTPNPHVPWTELPLRVAATTAAWTATAPRIAGVSSFGFSGTNAHVILEEATPASVPDSTLPPGPLPILLSARSAQALQVQRAQLQHFVVAHPEARLVDVACTLATARTHFEQRAGFIARDRDELLAALAAGRPLEGEVRGGGLALLLTGQGSQRARMGVTLQGRFPVFRAAFAQVLAALADKMEQPLGPVLLAAADPALDETAFTQPALFALEVALFRLFESWGVVPSWLVGHSVGEIAAAHISGVLGLEDACTLVAARGRLMQALPRGGAMVALSATEDEVRPLLGEARLALAAVNGPRAVVISGDEPAVLRLAAEFTRRGRRAQRLRVSHAFHSPHMDAMLGALAEVAAKLTFSPPQIPIISTVTGRLASAAELCAPTYWAHQARATVRFADAVRALESAGVTTCLELGPHGTLSALAAECLTGQPAVGLVPSLRERVDEVTAIHESLLQLHVRGVRVDWPSFFVPLHAHRIALPTYPFERERHWLTPRRAVRPDGPQHPILGTLLPIAGTDGHLLNGRIALDELGWLADHKLAGEVILPGTAFLELALEAARQVGLTAVEELAIEVPLVLPPSGEIELQLALAAADAAGRRALTLHARLPGNGWRRHASGVLGAAASAPAFAFTSWPPAAAEPISTQALYATLAAAGLEYGAAFRRVLHAWRRDGELFVEVALNETHSPYALHPALLDAALHPLVGESLAAGLELPFAWSGVSLYARGAAALRVHMARSQHILTLEVADDRGRPVAAVRALTTRPVAAARVEHVYRVTWSHHDFTPQPIAGQWALVGAALPGLFAALRDAGVAHQRFATIEALRAALAQGAAVPDVITYHDDGTEVRAAVHQALAFLQGALADARLLRARLVLLTCRALATTAEDRVFAVAQAGLAGLCRAARAEHPQRSVLHVDLDGDQRSLAALPSVIAGDEVQVCLRQGAALVSQLLRLSPSRPERSGFATDGTVLVTGGTGALGSLIAQHLVKRHGVRELVLVSRHGAAAAQAERLQAELTQAGAQVRIVSCDLSERAATTSLLSSIPRLRGIVHAAGVVEDGLIAALDPARVDRVLGPKALAAQHLDALTQDLSLDYFVVLSSLAALVGPAGQAGYAAANAVLDALMHSRRAAGRPALTINFGPWAEVGMAARLGAVEQARLAHLGLGALSPAEALAGFDVAGVLGETQLAVAVRTSPPRRVAAAALTELPALTPTDREAQLRDWLRATAARALGLKSATEVPWERPLRELGMDSLVAIELRNAIAARLDRQLPATLLFDYPHLSALARGLADLMTPAPMASDAERVEAMSENELDALLETLQRTP